MSRHPSNPNSRPPAVVVGAGLAGLIAANELIDRGYTVSVFERSTPGGRSRTVERGPYRFNDGPHALYAGGAAAEALNRFDIRVGGHAPALKDALGELDGSLGALPAGPAALATTRLLSARGKLQLGSLLGRLPRMDTSSLDRVSVDEWLDDRELRPDARAVFDAVIRLSTYANSPDTLSAGAVVTQLQMATATGVLYLDGGWQRMIDALADRATGRGAQIVAERVDSLSDVAADAEAVVVAVGSPAATEALLGDGVSLVDAAGPPARAAVLEIGCERVPDRSFILGIDTPLYGSVHAPPADLAPAGHSVVALARYVHPTEDHDAATTRAELAALAERLGVRRPDIAEERYLHDMAVTHGTPIAARGGFSGRPAVDDPLDPRVRIAGDWVGDTGFLADASAASALAAVASLADARPAAA